LIADIDGSNFREIYRTMEIVRLGQGVDQNKAFHPDAIARTLAAVDLFAQEISKRGVEQIRFCATSATRDASNRELFIDGVKERLGIEPEVISGDEEARLSFIGATKEFAASDAPFLVVDIGGGSTEFVYGNSEVEFAKSVNIGCVRMTERNIHSDPPKAEEIENARRDIQEAIAVAALTVPITQAKTLIAVAGTATSVAASALDLAKYDRHLIHLARVSAQQTHHVAITFAAMNAEQRSHVGFLHPGRADVFAAGSLVLSEIMKATGAKEFVASEADILDGIAWSLARN
jgi:exopolyphosphatase/guanosine-5'-triphosphate,3'-diphosphate pyrophosphatase